MDNHKKNKTAIVTIKSNAIIRIGKSIEITNKIIFNGIEELFNEAFYLMNNKHFTCNKINVCFLLEYNSAYLRDKKYKYQAVSYESYKKAIELFTIAIERKPNHIHSYRLRGYAKHHLSDFHNAIEDYSKAIMIDPNYADAYYNRGVEKRYLKNYGSAIEDYSKAIEIDPSYAAAYLNRGFSKWHLGDYESGYEDFDKAIEVDSNLRWLMSYVEYLRFYFFAEEYFKRGTMKRYLKDYEGAIEDYTKSIKYDQNDANAYYYRGLAKEKIGDFEGAQSDKEMYNKLNQ